MLFSILKNLTKHRNNSRPNYLAILETFEKEIELHKSRTKKKPELKIMVGPSFSIYKPCFVYDRLFAIALELRGASITPIFCDGIQSKECNVAGGVWTNAQEFSQRCNQCQTQSKLLWKSRQNETIPLSRFISETEKREIYSQIGNLQEGDWESYTHDNAPFGRWARDILVNNWVVSSPNLIQDAENLGKTHLANLLLLAKTYQKVLDFVKPDRVLTNDSYYGMWATLQHYCEKNDTPFYSYWPATKQRIAVAHNDAAMGLNFKACWVSFTQGSLKKEYKELINSWLDMQTTGQNLLINTAQPQKHQTTPVNTLTISNTKPTAIMPTNVCWDLAALNKQIIFKDMGDWILSTIDWFSMHPHLQLIIKAHPAEQNPAIPETNERVETIIANRYPTLPDNVFFISPKSNISIYELLPFATIGIVHTTTAGIELSARGYPVITTAKAPYRDFGFTEDPNNKQEYYEAILQLLSSKEKRLDDAKIEFAKQFILFYHFSYYSQLNLVTASFESDPEILISSIEQLRPGNNAALDYYMDSILQGQPIVSHDRWPPIS